MAICSSCRKTLLARLHSKPIFMRYASMVPSTPLNASPSEPLPAFPNSEPPQAISSSKPGGSQPFSTPEYAPSSTTKAAAKDARKSTKLQGSIAGGQELRGIAYLKTRPTILAMEDDEYPDWLWKLLDEPKTEMGTTKVDTSAMTKKQRAKFDRKQERLRKNMPKIVPLHEQSKDLTGPGDDAATSLQRRQEVIKSSRIARRKGIREDNFLRSM